jgi:hypothetical protein
VVFHISLLDFAVSGLAAVEQELENFKELVTKQWEDLKRAVPELPQVSVEEALDDPECVPPRLPLLM